MSWKLADLGPRQPVIYLILIYANENKLSKYISSLGPGHHDGGNIIIISPNSSFFYSYDLKRWTTFLHRQYASQNLLSQFFDLWGVDVNDHDYTIAQRWLVHVCTFICCWLYSHTMLAHRQRSSLWVQHRLQQLRQADKYLPRDKDAAWWRFCPLTDSRQGNLHTETSILRIKRPWRVKIWPTTDIFDVRWQHQLNNNRAFCGEFCWVGFPVVCFLCKINPNHTKIYLLCAKNVAQNATFSLIFRRLGSSSVS